MKEIERLPEAQLLFREIWASVISRSMRAVILEPRETQGQRNCWIVLYKSQDLCNQPGISSKSVSSPPGDLFVWVRSADR